MKKTIALLSTFLVCASAFGCESKSGESTAETTVAETNSLTEAEKSDGATTNQENLEKLEVKQQVFHITKTSNDKAYGYYCIEVENTNNVPIISRKGSIDFLDANDAILEHVDEYGLTPRTLKPNETAYSSGQFTVDIANAENVAEMQVSFPAEQYNGTVVEALKFENLNAFQEGQYIKVTGKAINNTGKDLENSGGTIVLMDKDEMLLGGQFIPPFDKFSPDEEKTFQVNFYDTKIDFDSIDKIVVSGIDYDIY
ncbi:MAG: hypothetical protein K2H01_03930 [Ruminococcus sp.]|nr:hypothetical protein [Ruminococcus sp.]